MVQLPINNITKAVSSAVTSVLNKLSHSEYSTCSMSRKDPGFNLDDFEPPHLMLAIIPSPQQVRKAICNL